MSTRLHNYVRTYRKRSSLGQQDVAFLLGSKDRGNVCRYEQGHRLPSLRTALELAVILDVSITTLFGGIQKQVERNITERISILRSKLEYKRGAGRAPALISRQLHWLDDHHGRIQNEHRPA
jgi:transcriptional regulator with XRE-family HTH domain